MLESAMQRLARNALSAARLTNWSFGSSPLNPGGLPVWTSAADNMRRSQRWQHTWLSPLSTRTAAHGSAKIVEQQLTAKRWPGRWQSAAASDLLWSQQQWLQQGMATSAAANAAELPAATQPPAAAAPSAPKPWTPTDQLQKRKILPKRMGHLLAELEREQVQQAMAAKSLPDFGPGDNLQLKLSVPENRRRVAVVQGICIARRNRAWRTSFTIRNHIGTAGGIERTFPLFSPNIQEIVVLDSKKVRRAKLYYLRDRQPKEYRVSTKS